MKNENNGTIVQKRGRGRPRGSINKDSLQKRREYFLKKIDRLEEKTKKYLSKVTEIESVIAQDIFASSVI